MDVAFHDLEQLAETSCDEASNYSIECAFFVLKERLARRFIEAASMLSSETLRG
jgi:hypothetical protein